VSSFADANLDTSNEGQRAIRSMVETAWFDRSMLAQARSAIETAVDLLDRGDLRVAENVEGVWVVNEWTKMALALYMELRGRGLIQLPGETFDSKAEWRGYGEFSLKTSNRLNRVWMPIPSMIRHGSYVGDDARLLNCFVSMGAWIGRRTLIAHGARIGWCAQVGEDVLIASGATVGSLMLLPLNSRPVIVGNGAYVGTHCVLSEGTDPYVDSPRSTTDRGLLIGDKAVLGANVVINALTPIVDATGSRPREIVGSVPPNAVVVAGSVRHDLPAGSFDIATPIIVGWRRDDTDLQQSLHDALEKYHVAA